MVKRVPRQAKDMFPGSPVEAHELQAQACLQLTGDGGAAQRLVQQVFGELAGCPGAEQRRPDHYLGQLTCPIRPPAGQPAEVHRGHRDGEHALCHERIGEHRGPDGIGVDVGRVAGLHVDQAAARAGAQDCGDLRPRQLQFCSQLRQLGIGHRAQRADDGQDVDGRWDEPGAAQVPRGLPEQCPAAEQRLRVVLAEQQVS